MVSRSVLIVTVMLGLLSIGGCGGCSDGDKNGGKDEEKTRGIFIPNEIQLKTKGPLKELLDEKLTFIDNNGEEWIAPKGTLTDGASVPRLALWITNGRFDSRFLKAAVVHDAYCQSDNKAICPDQYQKKPWRAVHRMFLEACLAGGTSATEAKIMFAGVWIGGPRWDDPKSNLENVPNDVLQAGYDDCKNFIKEKERTPKEIENWMNKRETTVLEIVELQNESLAALDAENPENAEQKIQELESRLNQELEKAPNNLMLLSLKGYGSTALAKKYRSLQQPEKAEQQLATAEATFRKSVSTQGKNPSALRSLANVLILRENYKEAEKYAKEALKIEPEYDAAKETLKRAESMAQ